MVQLRLPHRVDHHLRRQRRRRGQPAQETAYVLASAPGTTGRRLGVAPIYFYSTIEAYSFLSNFSPHGFELDGRYWPTAEHYYQAQKFAGSGYAETIRRAATPHEAKELSLSPEQPVRPDWEQIKVDVMRRAVLAKFTTHAGL